MSGRRRPLIGGAVFPAALMSLALVGCSAGAPTPAPARTDSVGQGSAAGPASSPSPGPPVETEPAPEPTLAPRLGASENLDYFDFVSAGVLRADPAAGGRAFVDALAAGGFDKARMEVTYDRTAADLAADSIQFSVRINGECLIGQNGPATGGYHSAVAEILGTGRCLVGRTRQIDW